MLQIDILNKSELNQTEITAFMKANDEESELPSILQSPIIKEVYAAIVEERIAGLIVSWKNSFHPHCVYFRMLIEKDNEAAFIAENLLAKLTSEEKLPLQTSLWETDIRLLHFYEKQGFNLIRKTYMPTVWIQSLIDFQPTPYEEQSKTQLISLKELTMNPQLRNDLTKLTKKTYEDTHQANPPGEFALEKWDKLIHAPDTLMELSFIYLGPSQEILAFSFLHEAGEGTAEIGWVGLQRNHEAGLLIQLVSLQIKQAREQGYNYITGEFDSTSPYSMLIYRNFSFPKSKGWNAYQRSADHDSSNGTL